MRKRYLSPSRKHTPEEKRLINKLFAVERAKKSIDVPVVEFNVIPFSSEPRLDQLLENLRRSVVLTMGMPPHLVRSWG
jgi:hypothetical protein